MHCTFCLTSLRPVLNWTSLFAEQKSELLCEECKSKLEFITGSRCSICSRPFSRIDSEYIRGSLCLDCYKWEQDPQWKGVLDGNTSIFVYNDFLKEIIALFKYRGDHKVAGAFAAYFPKKTARGRVVSPIPLSQERLYERGFNQSEAILAYTHLGYKQLLSRVHGDKQSKISRQERLENTAVFSAANIEGCHAQHVLLVDDIYTTGATVRQAAKVLKNAGANTVISFTVAR